MSSNEIVGISISKDDMVKIRNRAYVDRKTTNSYIKSLIERDLLKSHPAERAISLEESLLKENAGLRLNLYKYKRKYKALNRILRGGLYRRIQWCNSLAESYMKRLNRADTDEEKKTLRALINLIRDEKSDLEKIYEMCIEAIKD